jgi:TIGR03009 family protein
MRPLGLTLAATVLCATVTWAQQPGNAGVPPIPPVVPAGVAATNNLDTHLAAWERTLGGVTNFRFEIGLTRTDAVFKKDKKYDGVVLCMKPNFAILRLNYTADLTKTDYEAYICNGKSLFQYNGVEKSVTEFKLPGPANNPAGGTDNLMLDFLSGLKAKEAKQRFDISLWKEDPNYIYLDIKPLLGRDKQEFQQIRMALFGPNTKFAYLPAQVYKVNPNGDSEMWSFSNPQTNLPGIAEKDFQYVKVPGFTERQAPPPAQPMRPGQQALPGANGLPPGPGGVRP